MAFVNRVHRAQRPRDTRPVGQLEFAYVADNSFHEKAGMSQVCFSLFFEPAASVAILPSALLVERFSLGASIAISTPIPIRCFIETLRTRRILGLWWAKRNMSGFPT